ncbi:hypothetical protein bmyco0001_19100 [Bacillus mycoides DSM 2048]|nr:hypothetical protein bmyco0001_19100 [Bacillus mycoides DSM 2048]
MVGGISLLNPTTINITQAGDYRISFISSINLTVALSFPYSPTISILLNNSLIPNFKATMLNLRKKDYQMVQSAISIAA